MELMVVVKTIADLWYLCDVWDIMIRDFNTDDADTYTGGKMIVEDMDQQPM